MTTDHNKDIATITYNHLNLPAQVTKTDGQYIQYIYDAAGIKLAQEVYNASAVLQKRTDYVGEFIYETTQTVPRALQFIQHEEGRIMPDRSEYQYHLKDHLGNVRLTFTTKPETTSYLATMETENEQEETQAEGFQITASARYNGIEELNHTPAGEIGTAGEVLRLNGFRKVFKGLSNDLQVQAGDNIQLKVYAKYADLRNNQSNVGTALLSLMASGAYTTQVLENGMVELFDGAGTSMGVLGSNSTPAGDVPMAYLNYTLFDEDMVPIPDAGGFQQISKAALIDPLTGLNQPHEEITLHVPEITQAGYIYIWVSHDGTQNYDIYFDDLSIDHQHGPVVQADDYYPFGLSFNEWKKDGSKENKMNTFQDQEKTDELDVDWVQFKWRNHYADIGRFFNVDPLANDYVYNSPYAFSENHVTVHVELEGLEKVSIVSIGADVEYRGKRIANKVSGSSHTNISSTDNAAERVVNTLKSESASDPKGIGFLGIFSHGVADKVFGKGGYFNGMTTADVEDVSSGVTSGEIKFADGAVIYLGGCNAGTDWSGNGSFAQELAEATGALVVAADNDQVGLKDESNGNMVYTTAYPAENEFNVYKAGQSPVGIGPTVDVNVLMNAAERRTSETPKKIEPIKDVEL